MLKNIPNIILPELLKVLDEMGHGSEICIGDGNFPAAEYAKKGNSILIRADGHGVKELLEAILTFFPLDTYSDRPVKLMKRVPGDLTPCPIWDEYVRIIETEDSRGKDTIEFMERYQFYEHAQKCYAIVATSEAAIYANIILKKGVIA